MNRLDAGRADLAQREPASPPVFLRAEDQALIDVRDLARSVVRARWLVVGIVAASLVGGLVITALQDREYESEATIYINARRAAVPGGLELGRVAGLAGMGEGGIVTETALLESRAVAEVVVDSLALHVRLVEPVASYVNVLRILDAPRDAAPGRFELLRQRDGTYDVRALIPFEGAMPQNVEPGTPFRLGDVQVSLLQQSAGTAPPKIVISIDRFDAAVRRLRRNLSVDQYARGAQVLSVRARNADSVRAAEIPNAVSRSFIHYRAELARADASNAVAFLRDQVATYALRLTDAEDRLREFREHARVLAPSEEASQQVRHLADLQARRNLLVAERDAIRTALARAENRSLSDAAVSPYRELAAFPVFLSNAAVQSVLRTVTELENELSELLVRRTPDSEDVQRLVQRIGELEGQLYLTARSYHDGLDNQITSLDASASRFSSGLETVPHQQVAYARLLREQQLLEEVYTLLQTRLKEAEIREVEDLSDVRIIDAALIPERPVSPRPALNVLLAIFVGLTLGLGVAVTRAVLDPRIRTRDDVIIATAGLPVVGTIPRFVPSRLNGRQILGGARLRKLLPGTFATPLVVHHDPDSVASEAFRALRTHLTLGFSDRPPRLITMCSVAEREGKSTNAANLALAMAQQGARVLLVDCDLRVPRLHEIFAVARQPGVTDVLLDGHDIERAITTLEFGGARPGGSLHLLPAGSHVSSPAEIVASPPMRKLLLEMRERYDLVILDAPPLGRASEAGVLGVLSDATLLVARATVTQKRALSEGVAQLHSLRIPIAGVIINDVDPADVSYVRRSWNGAELKG